MTEKKEKINLKKSEIDELVSLYSKKKEDLPSLYRARKLKKSSSSIQNNFVIGEKKETYNKRMKLREKTFHLSVGRDTSASFIAFIQSLTIIINYILNVARVMVESEDDYVRFIFSHAPARYFSTAVLPLKEFNVKYFLNVFEKNMQSNKNLTAKGWETLVTIQTFPSGYTTNNKKLANKSRKKNYYKQLGNLNDDAGGVGGIVKKYGRSFRNGVFQVICPKLNSVVKNCCFVVSLLIGLSFLNEDEECKKMKRAPHKGCDDLYTPDQIRHVYQAAGIPSGSVKTSDIPLFYSNFLAEQGVDLVVFSQNYDDNIIYDSRTDDDGNLIKLTNELVCLWLNNNHYDVILSIKKFNRLSHFCVKCMSHLKQFEHKDNHICYTKLTCHKCFKQSNCPRIMTDEKIQCNICKIIFYSRECYLSHLSNRIFKPIQSNYNLLTPCQYLFFCEECDKICPKYVFYKKSNVKKHKCGNMYCFHCQAYKKKDHYCYMKPAVIKCEDNKLFFFDFETRVDDSKLMIPFYCVVQKVCKKCENVEFKKNENNYTECCGDREFIFEEKENEKSVVNQLCEFILLQENSVWIAHNGGRFDTIFIFKFLLEEEKIFPDTIMSGNKIMRLYVPKKNITFFDSFSFLHMRLASIPKAMGISDLCKGFHPYFFYDLNYVGEMIDEKFFDTKNMDEKTKDEFKKWYDEKSKKGVYNFREEMYYYCGSDVDILRKGCIKFSQLFSETSKIVPFYDTNCITIASLALKIFRYNFLRKKCIGIIPATGYRGKVNQSLIGLIWLSEINNEVDGMLEYRCSLTGEKELLGRYVDGYYDDVVYQFHGCFFHGCPNCFHPYDYNPVLNEKYCNLYSRTKNFTFKLQNAGYRVVEKWECDFIREKNIPKSEFERLKTNFLPYIPLEPRNALYGGRTSPACLFKKTNKNEKIFYIDFTSLYPYVQKKNKFPTGHPVIYIDDECDGIDLNRMFGLIKCKILPPRNLYFPVLPFRHEGKLLFPLCKSCAEKTNLLNCEHSVEERCITGTWTTIEVNEAIKNGYQIIKTYEIYHYTRQEKFFSQYVNCFLKIKQEASGFPSDCYVDGELDEEKCEKYISDYHKYEGIKLEKENIKYNAGLRTIAKNILNALWGKFAQNENNTKVEFISEYEELLNLANDNNIDLTSVDFVNEEVTRVTYKNKDEMNIPLKTGNVIVASFVTSYARLELFKLINKLQERVLYFDTDSVIYLCGEGEEQIETGNYLGELTNELPDNEWITQFCSSGPKSYSYITNLNNETVHIKGFSLNNEDVKQKLNFLSIRTCVENKDQIINIKYTDKITKDKLNHIFKADEEKKFSFTFNKRVVKDDFYTVPYGFIDV